MAGRIRQADVDEVKARTNIADIIGERVALKTAGVGAMKGLCPFHDERSPSFNVRPQAGFYHCFGCGESGDVYSFLRAMDHVSFTEAVERLAGRIGYTLHYEDGGAAPETHRTHPAVRGERRRRGVLPRSAGHRRGRHRPPLPRRARIRCRAPPRTSASATRPRAGRTCTRALLRSRLHRRRAQRRRTRLAGSARRVRPLPRPRRVADPRRHRPGHRLRRPAALRRRQRPEVPQHARDDRSTGRRRCSTGSTSPSATSRATTASSSSRATPTSWRATWPASRPRSRRCGTAFGSDHITVLRRVMGDDSHRGRGGVHLRSGCRGPEGRAARIRRRQALHAQTYVAVGSGGARPVRSASAARRRRRPRPDGRQGADGRVRHRPAPRGLRPRERRGPGRRAAGRGPDRRRAPRSARCSPEYVRVLARRLGLDTEESGARSTEPAAAASARRTTSPRGVRADGARRASPSCASRSPRFRGRRRSRSSATRSWASCSSGTASTPRCSSGPSTLPFRHPALDAVRQAVAAAPDVEPAGWAADAVGDRARAVPLARRRTAHGRLPGADGRRGRGASASDLARRLVARALDQREDRAARRDPARAAGFRGGSTHPDPAARARCRAPAPRRRQS